MKRSKDELSLDITSSAADLLTSLRYHLSFVELYLSPSLTVDVFETLATRIDKLLITEVYVAPMHFMYTVDQGIFLLVSDCVG